MRYGKDADWNAVIDERTDFVMVRVDLPEEWYIGQDTPPTENRIGNLPPAKCVICHTQSE